MNLWIKDSVVGRVLLKHIFLHTFYHFYVFFKLIIKKWSGGYFYNSAQFSVGGKSSLLLSTNY